jgi:hypothetical protein
VIRNRMPRGVAPIVAAVVALSVGAMGVAQGSSPPPGDSASASKGKKKRHVLDAAWKTGPQDVIGEEEFGADYEGTDEAKLVGRPFAKKALLDEEFSFNFNKREPPPRLDYSGTYHVTFDADVFARGTVQGTFRGFYDYSVDSEGVPVADPIGRITGGTRALKGATGSFRVVDLHTTSTDPVKLAGRWKGSIRY